MWQSRVALVCELGKRVFSYMSFAVAQTDNTHARETRSRNRHLSSKGNQAAKTSGGHWRPQLCFLGLGPLMLLPWTSGLSMSCCQSQSRSWDNITVISSTPAYFGKAFAIVTLLCHLPSHKLQRNILLLELLNIFHHVTGDTSGLLLQGGLLISPSLPHHETQAL